MINFAWRTHLCARDICMGRFEIFRHLNSVNISSKIGRGGRFLDWHQQFGYQSWYGVISSHGIKPASPHPLPQLSNHGRVTFFRLHQELVLTKLLNCCHSCHRD